MGFVDLFSVASMPVLKVLIVTGLGSFLALDSIDILGPITRKLVNNIVFFVFSPALVGSNLAKIVTLESIISMWFMPVNILLTYILGSVLGWMLLIVVKPPQHLKGLIIGACSAGNLGNLPLIIIPSVCKEKGSPFGDSDVCQQNGMAYASVSLAIGAVFVWTYVYNLVRVFSSQSQDSGHDVAQSIPNGFTECLLTPTSSTVNMKGNMKVMLDTMKELLGNLSRRVNLKAVFAPSTIGAIMGFLIGIISPVRSLLIGTSAPLRVIQDSASLIGDAAIPTMTLIVGGNLLRGLEGSGVSLPLVLGIVVVKLVFLPFLGILIVKGAVYIGLVQADPLYLFVLLLQFALPPAMNIGWRSSIIFANSSTITQLFGAGENEYSVIMLWAYGLASVSLTLWSMLFMWLVA